MQKQTEKVPKKCSKGSPRRSQSGPKIHQKSLKIGPCSQMAPQGHPGMPLGTPGPPKWSPGTSKVTIWDLKSYHFTLISNYVSYQNSKKGRSFPLFFVVFGCSFRRQLTSQVLNHRHGGGARRRQLDIICHLSSIIYHLSYIIYHLSSSI